MAANLMKNGRKMKLKMEFFELMTVEVLHLGK
jgi:hypothetical protein